MRGSGGMRRRRILPGNAPAAKCHDARRLPRVTTTVGIFLESHGGRGHALGAVRRALRAAPRPRAARGRRHRGPHPGGRAAVPARAAAAKLPAGERVSARRCKRRLRLPQAASPPGIALGVPRERTSVLFYEPTPYVKDDYYEVAARRFAHKRLRHRRSRRQARHPRLDVACRGAAPRTPRRRARSRRPSRSRSCRRARTSFRATGRGSASSRSCMRRGCPCRPSGAGFRPRSVRSAGFRALQARACSTPARFALALENHVESPYYITEKLWDALLCWCLPFYFGHEVRR